ncbi:hypothetical protein [Vibrio jasicida]|uniref:hypothetical protein n=1 Tax=Vibrio jasicida TaxID=766224 RepID=UPI0003A6A2E6|nr:hypothetical protein [Vibrio jasicida]
MTVEIQTTPTSNQEAVVVHVKIEVGDYVIPIVYPDYLVAIPPEFQELWGVKILDKKEQFGHAGALIINGKTGLSKYYEYGRYEQFGTLGGVNNVGISDAVIEDGRITESSLANIMSELSQDAGQGGRIEAVVFIGDYYDKAYEWLTDPKGPYRSPDRQAYDVTDFNCMQFVLDLLNALDIETHWTGFIVKPDDEMEELQEDYKDLRYTPGNRTLEIEDE